MPRPDQRCLHPQHNASATLIFEYVLHTAQGLVTIQVSAFTWNEYKQIGPNLENLVNEPPKQCEPPTESISTYAGDL